ncbi:MAG: riboflavin biosynthesis protein RibF [Coriobacteriia bacterium]|nr:riboflavin biosynthesis protein RibF [Coriobacteriia bacterium]
MTASITTWQPGTAPLGSAVVAIGVFDGVHLGHQALLRDTVADAKMHGVQSVAVTFDRDPDQIVSPDTAAPQLLTLSDKLAAISRTGIEAILVVPFTSALAEQAPESFLDSVLLAALTPVAVHVGSDFRFGTMATGDVSTLQRVGAARGFDVVPHDLVTDEGQAITSTRIRALVADGKIAEASRLLGGHPCVTGTVHRGRGEGASLGFPTANVVPVEFAALPGSGVYAGRAALADGSGWAAAISVGTPPMFPDAKDYLEAHLVDYEGDLYDQPLTLEFWDRIRDQQAYPDLDALKAAIAADVDGALEIAGFTDEELAASAAAAPADAGGQVDADDDGSQPGFWDEGRNYRGELLDAGSQLQEADYISDPTALEAAEQAAMNAPDSSFGQMATGEWVPVVSRWFTSIGAASAEAFVLVAPLQAANIPYAWNPFPPDEAWVGVRDVSARDFTVLVPAEMREQALAELQAAAADASPTELPADSADFVDDPAALEAAEQAAQDYREPQKDADDHRGEDWVAVLADLPFDKQRFLDIDGALVSAGIDRIWEPYAPEEAPLIRLGIWDTERFSVSVPESEVESAKALLASLPDDAEHW